MHLLRRRKMSAGKACEAIKDDLYRLTTSTNTSDSAQNQTWAYDAISRITNNSRIGNYTYPSVGQARPHAPTQAGSNSYSYDNNGNLTAGAGQAPAWDANNRISSVTAGGTTVNFTYDANGERLKKATAASTSLYPVEDYEITNGVVTKYINLKGLGGGSCRSSGGKGLTHHPAQLSRSLRSDVRHVLRSVDHPQPHRTAA